METIEQKAPRYATCTFCDGGCLFIVEGTGDDALIMPADPNMPAQCSKVHKIDEYRHHPDRVVQPLKNVGDRKNPQWEQVSWDEALDDISARLKDIIAEYGAESVAFFETPLNHGFGGITRRLMNCLGAVNYTCPTQLCMGNTAQVNRAVYGWFVASNWENTDCILYYGQNRNNESWPKEYLAVKAALDRGAKLIVVDPRRTEMAEGATLHVPLRYGTDAAFTLGMLNVIISEKLYDKEFVDANCIGFDELAERVSEYDPEAVAGICGIDANIVREAARIYASANAAIIPWGVVPDMQVNSTSLIQCFAIMRAICGFVNVSETVFGPSTTGISSSQLSEYSRLTQEQRDKQLGRKTHPLLTMAASELYFDALKREGIDYEPDIMAETCASDPATLFAAMRGEGPYDVKASIIAANNTVMSYANQPGIIEALLNQDLIVVYDHWITPTAQMADYVLPGDIWAERDVLGPQYDVAPLLVSSQGFLEPEGECRNWYDVVKGLADRLGLAEDFPWANCHELYDYCLAPTGKTYADLLAQAPTPIMLGAPVLGRFATPSGKVELRSSVLEKLGFDPLPSYVEPADPAAENAPKGTYSYVVFAGARDHKSYNTNLHQIKSLRELEPEPLAFINPADAKNEGLSEGDWCHVISGYGQVTLMVHVDDRQPAGTVRVPHGWWKPETKSGLESGLSGASLYNDGMLFPDENWNLDPAQGVPNLRGGIHVRIEKAE